VFDACLFGLEVGLADHAVEFSAVPGVEFVLDNEGEELFVRQAVRIGASGS